MDIPTSLAIVAFAALLHASFQLSVSVLTLLSSHSIGSKRPLKNLLSLTTSFVIGAAVMTLLLLSFVALVVISVYETEVPLVVWAVACGLLSGVGIAVWIFYYRREQGTSLWLPRGTARFLSDRTKATTHPAEAFSLGLTSVIAELLFIIAPLLVSALVLVELPALWQLIGIAVYTVIASLSLIIVWVLIGSGHALSGIQKWRESNKRFLQFAAGSGLLILGIFVYVSKVLSTAVGGM
ncbi:MAG: rane protein of unknown function [Candidatus Saccharibacteria bacterium]|nr:rane protein of unknown function [Candidatus Saccharibacteria bacterium]